MTIKKRFISLFITISILLSLFSINNVVFSETPNNTSLRLPPVPIYITISDTSASIKRGEGLLLTASIDNEADPNATVGWTSSDETVATVSDDGYVIGCSAGTATITAIYSSELGLLGVTTARCEVTVSSDLVLENGTNFLKNKQTNRYADIKGPTMASGTTIHQWKFHGGNSQQWILTNLGDGYYSIKSNNSSTPYYLGVKNDSTGLNVDIVLRTGALTDGMKWKIVQTKNGAYKIIPKTGESSDYILGTSTSNATNGAKLIQGAYVDNDSYRDEWCIHLVEHVVAIGGEFLNGEDVIATAERWKNAGYSTTYNINPTVNSLNFDALNSEVVYFSAHGTQHGIYLLNNVLLTDGFTHDTSQHDAVYISDHSITNAKLYIYDACETASNVLPTNMNLCTATIDAGADCVIGWTPDIHDVDSLAWQARFQSKLIEGFSVKAAADYANTFSYYSNESIKSWRIFGNEDLVVNQDKTVSTNVDESLKNTSIQYQTHNINALKSVLSTQYADFSLNSANVTITYTNSEQTNYVIDYYYLHNGYTTESGYSLIVNNGVITHIRDNTIQNRSNTATASARYSTPSITPETIEAAYAQGREKVYQMGCDYSVIEQSADKYYDIIADKYYYRVFNVYQAPNGGYGATISLYEIH